MATTSLPVHDDRANSETRFFHRLRCPVCLQSLSWRGSDTKGEGRLACQTCGREFPVHLGVAHVYVPWEPDPQAVPHPFRRFLLTVDRLNQEASGDGPLESVDPESFWTRPLFFARVLLWGLIGMGILFPGGGPWIALWMSVFIVDGAGLAWARRRRYRQEVRYLLKLAQQGHFQVKDLFESSPDVDQLDPREVALDRDREIEDALGQIDLDGKEVLHIGCGGEHDTDVAQVYRKRGAKLTGLDIYAPSVRAFRRAFHADGVLADALRLPFADESFDVLNATDIIEHVFDPFRFLTENRRVLKPGGRVLIVTPNRGRVRKDGSQLNPWVLLQSVLGNRFPTLLPPREMTSNHRDVVYFHTSFSSAEMKALILAAGFHIESIQIKAYRGPFKKARRLLEKAPLARNLNDSLFVMARKPGGAGK